MRKMLLIILALFLLEACKKKKEEVVVPEPPCQSTTAPTLPDFVFRTTDSAYLRNHKTASYSNMFYIYSMGWSDREIDTLRGYYHFGKTITQSNEEYIWRTYTETDDTAFLYNEHRYWHDFTYLPIPTDNYSTLRYIIFEVGKEYTDVCTGQKKYTFIRKKYPYKPLNDVIAQSKFLGKFKGISHQNPNDSVLVKISPYYEWRGHPSTSGYKGFYINGLSGNDSLLVRFNGEEDISVIEQNRFASSSSLNPYYKTICAIFYDNVSQDSIVIKCKRPSGVNFETYTLTKTP